MIRLLAFTTLAIYLAFASSCQKDDDRGPVDENGLYEWSICNADNPAYYRLDRNSPCTICNTFAGYRQFGKGGKLCAKFTAKDTMHIKLYLAFFDWVPEYWPSDTLKFYLDKQNQFGQNSPSNGSFAGGFSAIGLLGGSTASRPFTPPSCQDLNPNVSQEGGFIDMSTSSGRFGFYDQDSFSFLFGYMPINDDCDDKWAHGDGDVRGDTAHLTLTWFERLDLTDDTLAVQHVKIVPMPDNMFSEE